MGKGFIYHINVNAIMNNFTLFLCALIFGGITKSQNLVPNPSFEIHSALPSADNQMESLVHSWQDFRGEAEYFHEGDSGAPGFGLHGVPVNDFGIEPAQTGVAYVGIWTSITAHDYIGAMLSSPVVAGQTYYISFWTSLADESKFISFPGVSAAFTDEPLVDLPLPWNPVDLVEGDWLLERNGWTQFKGTITPINTCRFLALGTFRLDGQMLNFNNWPLGNLVGSYAFIDNVCVSTDSTDCFGGIVSTMDTRSEAPSLVYPNPSAGRFHIRDGATWTVFRIDGTIVLHGSGAEIDISSEPPGVYFVRFADSEMKIAKLLKI